MKKELITYKDPKSPVSEMFRTLRTNIQFMNTKSKLKSLLVTSTIPGEGKSWITANLAVTFAQADKKVVIVDADMRKGRQFSIFGVSPTPGLSNYLVGYNSRGEELPDDVKVYIKNTEIKNLYIIPAGNIPPNPSELLVSEKMVNMINMLENMFDIVIFDGTPSSIVTDAVIISRFVDSTIIVTAHKETKIDTLERIKKDIRNVGGHIAGVVLNKMPITKKKYQSTYYYGNSDRSFEKKEEIKNKTKKVIKDNPVRKKDIAREKEFANATRIQKEHKNQNTYQPPKKNKMFDYEKEENKKQSVSPETDKIMKQLNDYLTAEKAKLKNSDEQNRTLINF